MDTMNKVAWSLRPDQPDPMTKKLETPVSYRGRIKYNAQTAQAYQKVDLRKHASEMRLIDRAFKFVPPGASVLDAPCGGGRVALHLARHGYKVSAADLSDAMIAIAKETMSQNQVNCPVEKQDVENLTYADRSFDAIVCFRLFHHFPDAAIRERVIKELCRVAGRFVVLSYFSPLSVTSVKRSIGKALGGKRPQKHATSLREIAGYFGQSGFRLVKNFARVPILHTLHLAVFERTDAKA